jgi:DNA-directed RNA polymerase subunit beta'
VTDAEMAALRDDSTVDRVRVLSPLTDESELGISAASYGLSLATGKMIEEGEAVGVIAAQSIGEPGTQLTMRTFHTGGIAGAAGDITGGLPRVVELFEARSPRNKATLARTSGVVRIGEDDGKGRTVIVVGDDGTEDTYVIDRERRLEVTDGQEVTAGDALVEGPRDPKELLEIKGVRATQQYLVDQVQKVYRDQGVSIHDKHIELIVRQMTRRIAVQEPGESTFLPGERVDARVFSDENRRLVQDGSTPAEGRPELMGITKASLATDSWLSAASFQETTRVLTEAAIEGKSDSLLGLKENIIIGKLIPAGTGMGGYRDIGVNAPEYQPMEYWSSDTGQSAAEWLASIGSSSEETDAEIIDLMTGGESAV